MFIIESRVTWPWAISMYSESLRDYIAHARLSRVRSWKHAWGCRVISIDASLSKLLVLDFFFFPRTWFCNVDRSHTLSPPLFTVIFFKFILTASVLQSERLFAWTSKMEASQNDAGITLSLTVPGRNLPVRRLEHSAAFVILLIFHISVLIVNSPSLLLLVERPFLRCVY